MLKEFSLEGRTALITGAGRGIGRAIASTLAEAGDGYDFVYRRRSPSRKNDVFVARVILYFSSAFLWHTQ